jgi:hypothetical protein
VRDIIRKILKEQTEVIIPSNKKQYVDRALKIWETDPMSSKSFISTFGIDRDMAIYIRQKMAEQLSNVPIGKEIWTLGKDFPEVVGVGNYDIKFVITQMDDLFPDYLLDEEKYGRINSAIVREDVGVNAKILTSGTVHINIQQDDGEYELIGMPIMEAITDEDFGWEVESEIKDIIWFYICTISPLALKFNVESDITLFSENDWDVGLVRRGYD